ncbi:unnamed protein product [Mytilus edulis]|uniref:CUB domain-containing protein n=1 Tax=Mytilus edulis TaxID=6550 RepID=A0A8S3RFF5_MYTED|nr:unnamed protein product [Mytilus edulis]
MKFTYLPLLVITFVNTLAYLEVAGQPCSNASHLPVVNMCEDETKIQDASNSILIKADSMQNCTCELLVVNQNETIELLIQRYGQETSSSPSDFGCGLILYFDNNGQSFWEAQCKVSNASFSTMIGFENVITIQSVSVRGALKPNEGYCIEMRKASYDKHDIARNRLSITCGNGSTTSTYSTQSTDKTTKMTQITSSLQQTTQAAMTTTNMLTTTSVPTTTTTLNLNYEFDIANFTSTEGTVSTKQASQPRIKDNDDTITLTVGASIGGLIIIIVVIIIVCIYRRNHKKTLSKPAPAVDTNNGDYGLRENFLYVSSEPFDTTQTANNADIPITHRKSIDIDGNYSTVDLDEVPATEESTGDYSSIDLEKPTPTAKHMNESANKKPIIAPKPKQKTVIQDDVYAVPDKKRVKHVTAPGADGV